MKVLLKTAVSRYTGYGNDGLGMVDALWRAGADVYLYPTHVAPPLSPLAASLLTRSLDPPFDMIIHHADPMQLEATDRTVQAAPVRVAWTMWEACVDPATEIFTKRGWLSGDEVMEGDETLSLNPDTNMSEWVPVEFVFRGPSRPREMLLMESESHSSLTTMDHRWLVRANHGRWLWKTSDTLTTGNSIPRSAPCSSLPVDKKYDDALVALVAWTYTEGWLERGLSIRIGKSSVAYPQEAVEIRGLLTDLYGSAVRRNNPHGGVTWSERTKSDGMVIFNLSRAASAEVLALCPAKVPSRDFLLALTQEQLDLFIDTSVTADGYTNISDYFTQTNGPRLEAFIFACVLAGRVISPPHHTSNIYVNIRNMAVRRHFGVSFVSPYTAAYSRRRGHGGSARMLTVVRDVSVWCPTVKHGNWLARRNGCVYYTGNSSTDNMARRSTLRKRLSGYTHVVAYDHVTRQALAPHVRKRALLVAQGGFDPSLWKPVKRDWHSERFGFCMVGALHERKQPMLALDAFRELKEEKGEAFAGASLSLKTNVTGLHSAMETLIPRLKIYYALWPNDVLLKFYASQHVLLAPSRGEGKNVPALEMMSTGGTVIATGFGGHEMWLSDQFAYRLDRVLAPVAPDKPDCLQARASKAHLKELMWRTYTHRAETAAKGALAAKLIPEWCSWDTRLQELMEKLARSGPEGQKAHAKWAALRPRQEAAT